MATGSYRDPLAFEKNYANSAAGKSEAAARARVEAQARAQGINPYQTYNNKLPASPTNVPTKAGSTPLGDPRVFNPTTLGAASRAAVNEAYARMNPAPAAPAKKKVTGISTSSGGGRSYGGGGGGGGAAAPMLSQTQLDWMAQLLQSAGPHDITATALDLPDYNPGPFDVSMYDTLLGQFNQGVQMDRDTATGAYQNLTNYLTQNQTNAFSNGNTAPTYSDPNQQASMARLLQGQGVNAGANPGYNSAMQGQAAGDSAFSNLWRVLGANEDTANRNRLGNVQMAGLDTQNALNVAALSGQTGIGLQRSQAQAAYNQQVVAAQQQVLQQEALNTWQRANQVQDTNATNTNSYRNSELQALLGLLPQLAGNPAALPTMQALGLA